MKLHDLVCYIIYNYLKEEIKKSSGFYVYISHLGKKEKVKLIGIKNIPYRFSTKEYRADLLLVAENNLLLPLEVDITSDNTDSGHKSKRNEALNLSISLVALDLDQQELLSATEEKILQIIKTAIKNGNLFYIVKSKPQKMIWKGGVIHVHSATVKSDYITFFDINGIRYIYSKNPLPPKRMKNLLKEYKSQSYYISSGNEIRVPFKY